MTRQRREAIYAVSKEIRSILKLETPVNLNSTIKDKLYGECIEGRMDDDISGKIEKTGNTFKITLNNTNSSKRNNFTLAHELGHLFLHMGYMLDMEKWNTINEYIDSPYYRMGYSEEEYEANHFAGSLLMPEDEYHKFVKENISPQRTISIPEISDHFNVSEDAALTRGRWLGIFSWG
jgi:Zn-dependent peptidase ImmA (M78 family)